MSFKASTPIFSKPNAAEQDHSTIDDEVGNLSERRIRARFETLAERTKRLFEKLETEFEKRPIDSITDIFEWNVYLRKTLDPPDLVDLFTKWMYLRGPKSENDLNRIENVDVGEFKRDLEAANWKYDNEAYDRVFHLMWNTRSEDSVTLVLKSLPGARLGVTVNPRCIIPQDPLHGSIEAYDIVGSNLINILGLRYKAEHATKEMIIAPFGHLVYAEPKGIPWEWRQSEYALVLEIRDDGTVGDFYLVYNGTHTDEPALGHEDLRADPLTAKAEDGAFNFKPLLCGQGPFTVGMVKKFPGLELLGCHDNDYWNWMYNFKQGKEPYTLPFDFDADDIIQVGFLSTSRPEIVMTGMRESQKGREIVGLYDDE